MSGPAGFTRSAAPASPLGRGAGFHAALRALLGWKAAVDGRGLLLASVAVYLTAVASTWIVWRVDLWPYLGVPPGPSLFFDARNLTAAWECQRLGYDPLYENPCDPWKRPLMYLRPWLLGAALGLGQAHTPMLAAALIAAMFLSFAALAGRVPLGSGVVLSLAACSPAVMLAVERANMDVALFTVVCAAPLIWRAAPRVGATAGPPLVLLAATAKIYPVFALPAFLLMRRRAAVAAALASAAAFVAYAILARRDIAHVAEIATQGQGFSYGARILLAHLYHQVLADRWAAPAALKQAIAVVPLTVAAAGGAIWLLRRIAASGHDDTPRDAPLLAFGLGALIYLGTFAVANNFDYRLVFLLLTLPQLIRWTNAPAHRSSRLAAWTLTVVLTQMWVGSLSRQLDLWDELASWAAAVLLTALLATLLPANLVRRLSGRRTPTA